jgi:non-ribosomal peptide synthetase component F
VVIEFDEETCSGLANLCKICECTRFVAFLTAYAIVLQEAAGVNDVVVGTPFRGRTEPEERDAVGYLIDVIPVRVSRQEEHDSVRTAMSKVSQTLAACITHARVPPEYRCGDGVRADSLYRAFFSLYDHAHVLPKLILPAESIRTVVARDGMEGTAKFDFSIELFGSDGNSRLSGSLVYDIGVVPSGLASAIASAFSEAVRWMSHCDASSPIDGISLVSHEEVNRQDLCLSHASTAWEAKLSGTLDGPMVRSRHWPIALLAHLVTLYEMVWSWFVVPNTQST